jgi:hypothetical protein
MWDSCFSAAQPASLQPMLHLVRGSVLLLLMALGQAETALALPCDQPALGHVTAGSAGHEDHTHCGSRHSNGPQPGSDERRAPHRELPVPGGAHDGPTCAAMLACGAAVALPSVPVEALPAAPATAPLPALTLRPSSRADCPGNPPPRT